MKLWKTPTREPELYQETDVNLLRQRVRQLEEVVEKYCTDRIPPFDVTVKVHAGSWSDVVHLLRQLADRAERHGPDGMPLAGGGGGLDTGGECAVSFSVDVRSGRHRGPGEGPDDRSESDRSGAA